MKHKKIILLTIFIICFAAISAVSAADNATDSIEIDQSSDGDVVNVENENIIISSNDEDLLGDSGTYSNLKSKIDNSYSGDTVYLYNNYTFSLGYSSSGIAISKKITLDGNGYTIDAENNCRIFSVSGTNVVLKNIVFKNAYYSGNGGAVYWSGSSGSIINCTFINDHSYNGGAVYWYGSSGRITDSTFTGNYLSGSNYYGGAVYWSSTYGTIDNCNFNNNGATNNYGGAVYWSYSNGNLKNSNFTNNNAYRGGAIYWSASSGTVDNCNFNSNTASNDEGGAVYWTGNSGNLKKSNFTNNKAYYEGGAVYWSGSSGTIDNCNFNNNGASNNYGGAVYWYTSNGNIKNSRFDNNKAYSGGAIYWYGDSGTTDNCNFNNNTASSSYGGAVYWTGDSGNLKRSNFNDNKAKTRGGAVYWYSSSGIIANCNFLNNNVTGSSGHGGAIYKDEYTTDIQNCNFINNSAIYGGALTFETLSSDEITNSNFTNNIADFGEAIEWYNSVCTITNTLFNGITTGYDRYFYISSKLTPSMTITADDITLGEKLDVEIEFDYAVGMNGNITISITDRNDEVVYSTVKNISSSIYLQIPNLKRGTHKITARYSGDNIYSNYTKTRNIEVEGKDSSIDFDVNDILWGTSLVINPKVTSGATGSIEIYVDDNFQDTIQVGSKYTFTNLGGPYSDIKLVYLGDDTYKSSSSTKRVYVERLDTNFIAPQSIESGNPAIIEININEDATGNIKVRLNGNQYSGSVTDGKFTFKANQLTTGTKSMTIEYGGDSKYKPFTTTFDVEVTMKVPTVYLDVSNILSGRNAKINPAVTTGATGKFSIYVDGSYKTQINYDESYSLSSPSIGKHTVRVYYSGDSYYASCENQTVFRVYSTYPIKVENTAVIYGSGKHLQATFYDEYGDLLVKKLVAFRVNGNDNVVMTDENGVAALMSDFKIGNYSITIINTIVNEMLTRNLEVFSSIQSQDMTQAYNTGTDFKVKLYGEDAKALIKGYAIFKVGSKNYAVMTDNEGYATLNAGLQPGTYTVITTNALTGESKTNSLKIFSSITADNMVRGYNSGMDFRARFVDNNNIPLINQKVTFKIGTRTYESTTDSSGYALLNEKLDVGKYQVDIFNRVTGEHSLKNLTIAERITENNNVIRIQGEDSYYTLRVIGDDGKPVGANEIVKISINKGSYEIRTASNGYASFKIDQNIGSYKITAEYKGFEVTNDVHVLERVNYIQSISTNYISYKQNEEITLGLYSYSEYGNVEFIITGNNGYKNTIKRNAESSISISVSGLNATRYTVTANYYDLENYKFSSASDTFTVFKINPSIIISTTNANVGENATIVVNIPDVDGYVVIKVANKVIFEDRIAKNGVIVKNIDYLGEGSYEVSVTYKGDSNYNMLTNTASLIIIQDKILTDIHAKDISITYGNNAYLVATLKDEYGYTLHNKNVSIYFNGINSILTTDNNGQVKLLISNVKANTYNAVISFVGDDIYSSSTKTVKVTVIKPKTKIVLTLKKVNVKKSAKTLVISATLKINGKAAAKKKLTFKFNGIKYTAKTNKKGVAKITIKQKYLKKLKVGKKVKYQVSYSKKTVKKTVKIKK